MHPDRFILGTVQFGIPYGINNTSGQPSRGQVFGMLDHAFARGIRQLDSADLYGDAQALIGSYMQERKKSFLVNTKFKGEQGSPITGQLMSSLDQLGLEKVNVYFYHRFTEMVENPSSLVELRRLKEEGRIEKIGISVYTNEEFRVCIDNADVEVIQLPFNLLDNYSRRGALMREAKEKGKSLQVRSVFLQGLFFKEEDNWPAKLLPLKRYVNGLKTLAREHSLTMYDLALRYAFSKAEIDQVIIGVDSKDQLENNLQTAGVALETSLAAAIDRINVEEEALLYPYNWK
ncbi:MAG TPA: aldo/keto reductase [Flavisolibacter sp.]|nr:aldo/keto reductase [Flavisolibacter sp.]